LYDTVTLTISVVLVTSGTDERVAFFSVCLVVVSRVESSLSLAAVRAAVVSLLLLGLANTSIVRSLLFSTRIAMYRPLHTFSSLHDLATFLSNRFAPVFTDRKFNKVFKNSLKIYSTVTSRIGGVKLYCT